jgi:hypothetical protein
VGANKVRMRAARRARTTAPAPLGGARPGARPASTIPLAEGFLTPEAVAAVAVELVAMAEGIDELAPLREQGIVSAEEFEAKKKQLLGVRSGEAALVLARLAAHP